ncbi:hypothetical protein PTSG_12186 [Salpingoeca rosetta]|uniref:Uncharacterized protein n=1 Tax=Salpingoeca rosetta (strain ATCC 50818 / BSB-021) TaxID=946362 RepID=F2U8T1_SALR5|nr:uncharacterized protein PTSG_12186 [Salpingoeca rosetta]EGD72789.1 hypothetical protein PTSG_12186 [Salpingoeca rosetta]|eukprot:XP_004994612.1 hypothetical protein PTSG_12186 [Salpingoeca rosetta]
MGASVAQHERACVLTCVVLCHQRGHTFVRFVSLMLLRFFFLQYLVFLSSSSWCSGEVVASLRVFLRLPFGHDAAGITHFASHLATRCCCCRCPCCCACPARDASPDGIASGNIRVDAATVGVCSSCGSGDDGGVNGRSLAWLLLSSHVGALQPLSLKSHFILCILANATGTRRHRQGAGRRGGSWGQASGDVPETVAVAMQRGDMGRGEDSGR